MDDEDRARLDRIELLLQELLSEVRARPRKPSRRRGPAPLTAAEKASITQADLDAVDIHLAAAGYWRR